MIGGGGQLIMRSNLTQRLSEPVVRAAAVYSCEDCVPGFEAKSGGEVSSSSGQSTDLVPARRTIM